VDAKSLQDLELPRTLHETVQRRTRPLSDEARRLISVAAASGERFDFDILQRVVDQDEHTHLNSLKELIATCLPDAELRAEFLRCTAEQAHSSELDSPSME
jgi:predicted ATPase